MRDDFSALSFLHVGGQGILEDKSSSSTNLFTERRVTLLFVLLCATL